jgi:signal transduction histidine kinase
MPENRSEIADLCREHEIAVELIERGESLEQMLDLALEECDRQMAKKEAPTRRGLRQLHGLIRLAHRARQNANGSEEADLSRVDQELRHAEAETRGLQRQLDGALADLDSAGADDDVSRKLGGLFDELLVLCHQINNPLTSVLGRAQIMQLKLAGDSESPFIKPINVVEQSAKRVAVLVQELANLLCVGRKVFVERTVPDYDSSSSSDGR